MRKPEIASAADGLIYRKTDDVVADARWIVEESRRFAHVVVDQTLVRRNWALGKRIAEEELDGAERADYGKSTVAKLVKCFVLIDLKTIVVTHQDVGQMDMYVRMYDELKRTEGDNPTLGILLCADTDDDIARYSVLHGNEQLFATKYRLCLPTDEELRAEIETQKTFYALQQAEKIADGHN